MKKEFLDLLRTDPDFRDEVRRLVLTDELLELPALVRALAERVRQLAEAQERTQTQLQALARSHEALARSHEALARSHEALAEQVQGLVGQVQGLTGQVRALAEAQERTQTQLQALAQSHEALARSHEALARSHEALVRSHEALAEQVQGLAEQVQGLVGQVQGLAGQVQGLAGQVQGLVGQVQGLAGQVWALAEAQERTQTQLQALAERVRQLAEAQERTERRLAEVETELGPFLELDYREKAAGYFSKLARRIRVLSAKERDELVEQGLARGAISDEEADDLLLADIILRGRARLPARPVYIVVEVSRTVDTGDVGRAWRRAQVLRRLVAEDCIAAVAGRGVTGPALTEARRLDVRVVMDGRLISEEGV